MPEEPKPKSLEITNKANEIGKIKEDNSDKPVDPPPWLVFTIFLLVTVIILISYGLSVFSVPLLLIELLIGAASISVGSFLGFLFGMPRTKGDSSTNEENQDEDQISYLPSTNLEQVSDWLTKILIGVGLVELRQIGGTLASMGSVVAGSLKEPPAGTEVITQVVIIAFILFGFIASFLWTRIYYGPLQTITDRSLRDKLKEYKEKFISQKQATKKAEDTVKKIASGDVVTPAVSEESAESLSRSEDFDEQGLLPEVREKFEKFKNARPKWNSNPTAELFPNAAQRANGRVLEAEIDANMGRALVVTIRVRRESGEELFEEVIFLLHPTLTKPVIHMKPRNGKAEVDVYTEGWFTVVAITDGGRTVLSYNLKNLPGAPEWFKNN